MKKIIFIFLLSLITVINLNAQIYEVKREKIPAENTYSKGSIEKINMDFTISTIKERSGYMNPEFALDPQKDSKKSLLLAGLFSAAIPGAGELYTGNYLQSALFIGIEAASWIINVKYNKKGDDQTAFYQSYADAHWSVIRYATWVERNLDKIVPNQKDIDKIRPIFQSLYKQGNTPADQIYWDKLNEIERIIGGGGGKGQAFSHTLPKYGDQQYFELIGKYPQYSQGWDDSDQNSDGNFYDRVTENFRYYASERGKANDYYNTATTFVSIIVINHIVSAIDAVLMAHFHNKAHVSVSYNGNALPNGKIEMKPNFHLSINF